MSRKQKGAIGTELTDNVDIGKAKEDKAGAMLLEECRNSLEQNVAGWKSPRLELWIGQEAKPGIIISGNRTSSKEALYRKQQTPLVHNNSKSQKL